MGYIKIILAAVLMLVLCSEEVQAQANVVVCKQTNMTILIVKLQTGFKENIVLHRDGDKIDGTAWAWQSNGITAGHGIVTGYFGGHAAIGRGLVLEVVWQGNPGEGRGSFVAFQGPLHEGQGEDGRADDLNPPFSPVFANATTLVGCAKWPEHDAAFCQDYASKAVAAVKENVGLQCG